MKNRNKKRIIEYSLILLLTIVLGLMVNVITFAILIKAVNYPFVLYLIIMIPILVIVLTTNYTVIRLFNTLTSEIARLINSKNP